jgi:hypothetical protein
MFNVTFHCERLPSATQRAPTIYEALAERLGRAPTNAECRDDCLRIMREGAEERAAKPKRKGRRA